MRRWSICSTYHDYFLVTADFDAYCRRAGRGRRAAGATASPGGARPFSTPPAPAGSPRTAPSPNMRKTSGRFRCATHDKSRELGAGRRRRSDRRRPASRPLRRAGPARLSGRRHAARLCAGRAASVGRFRGRRAVRRLKRAATRASSKASSPAALPWTIACMPRARRRVGLGRPLSLRPDPGRNGRPSAGRGRASGALSAARRAPQ